MMRIDARVPVRFGPLDSRGADEAVLTDEQGPAAASLARFKVAPGHTPDCACCIPRSGAALALAALFQDRATRHGPMFRGVLAVVGPDGEAAVRAALEADLLVSGRFRLSG